MFEGIGGPINVDRADVSGIDPTLDSCCQREVESNRKRGAVEATLRRHDRIALAERRRKYLRDDLTFGAGCSCCYDHTDGGEYPALTELRSQQQHSTILEEQQEQEQRGNRPVDDNSKDGKSNEADSDSDSDSEFDYLLDEGPVPSTAAPDEDGSTLPTMVSAVMSHQWDRMVDLQVAAMMNESARQHGFGVHRQHHPQRVLQAAGLGRSASDATMPPMPMVVLHLFDPESMLSASLDLCLEKMTQTYRGTKFLRADGRSTLSMNQNLVQKELPKLSSTDIPALIAVRNGEVITFCPELTTLGRARDETIEDHAVEHFLWQAGVLLTDVPIAFEDYCNMQENDDNNKNKKGASRRRGRFQDIRQEDFYCCGVSGCNKSYRHEHVGIKNEEQSGLLVSENTAIGDNKN